MLRLSSAVLAGVFCGLSLTVVQAKAQLPANQDKTGEGATGHKTPDPVMQPSPTEPKTAAPGQTQGASKLNGTKGEKGEKGDKGQATDKGGKSGAAGTAAAGGAGKPGKPEQTFYDFELPGSDGSRMPLSAYKGKTVVLVNVARLSSYNTQLAALEKVSEQYKARGVVVVAVPSNEFGAAEPGTDAEVQKVYKVDGKVTFPVTAKAEVAGDKALPVYGFLTKGKVAPEPGPVHWNYTKFIVDKTGKPVARFGQDTAPDSPEFQSALEQVLAGTWKPKKSGGGGDGPGGGPEDGN